jgi:hypothetical protein
MGKRNPDRISDFRCSSKAGARPAATPTPLAEAEEALGSGYWRAAGAARGLGVTPALLSGQEPLQGQAEYVRAAAQAMLGGDEVAADEHREGEHAANLDLLLVSAEGAE